MTTTIGDVTFDITAPVNTPITAGYDKATRDSLTDDILIKVRTAATKSNLIAKLTKGLQVSTYKPSDIKDPNNFFNFVSQWEAVILSMETHLNTYYMMTPFKLYRTTRRRASNDDMLVYQTRLAAFLEASARNGGDSRRYVKVPGTPAIAYQAPVAAVGKPGDSNYVPAKPEVLAVAAVDPIYEDRPTEPPVSVAITDGGDILRNWHTMTLAEIVESVKAQNKYVSDKTHRQNLAWTFDYIMDCLDADLKMYVLSKLASINDPVASRSGPVAFMIVAQRIIQTTENLAQKVINGFIALRLTDFEGENVVEAIFTVRNVLKFLRYGEPNTYAPRTTLVLLYDIFRGSTVGVFRNYVQQAQDIVLKDETRVEIIFDHFQKKYEELLLADRWVPTKKGKSAFVMGDPNTKTYAEHDKNKSDGKDGNNNGKHGKSKGDGKTNPKKEHPTHDKSGRKIDYSAPKQGQSHTRTRDDGIEEHWCGKCGRWGSHKTDKHDEWRAKMKDAYKKKKKDREDQATTAGSDSRPRGTVTFVSALTGNGNRLAVDPELADGIDL